MGGEGFGWALGAGDRERVLQLVARRSAPVVVELGAGEGTVELARGLADLGGTLASVEHDPLWAEVAGSRIREAGLGGVARVVEAPLEPRPDGPPWYSRAALEKLPRRIDLLLVDGPPAGEPGAELAREPALGALLGRLADDAIVVLDDVHRPGERAVVERWEAATPFRFWPRSDGRIAVGTRGAL